MRVQRRFITSAICMLAALSLSAVAFAQDAPPEKAAGKSGDVIMFEREVVGPRGGDRIRRPLPPGDPGGQDTLVFISSEMSFDSKVVKGAPYSAQAITETTRALADGNRIRRETSASVYRDSEGRTRRDQELGAVGPYAVAGEPRKTVFINDPVSGVHYVLDPRTRTARKMPPIRLEFAPGSREPSGPQGAGAKVQIRVEEDVFTAPAPAPHGAAGGPGMHDFSIIAAPDKGATESLGKQTIEGVLAEGTRTTMTIPAGKIGNEQPIQIVWEKWYSPELQTVVMSKHSDPLVGETTYRLTNIVRSEPARTLFEVPSDYTVKDTPTPVRVIRRKKAGDEK
ncbi:MAG TPA: hypothetical protein VN256_09680 [Pyrinomonadaceae bacterium]|nr:hypothetical protein [Pyrinomonadaceae bacterium]